MNPSTPYTLDDAREFAACRDRFFASPAAGPILAWCFPDLSRQAIAERANAFKSTEDFQHAIIGPVSKRILSETSLGLTISGLDRLPKDRKFLFLSNHRCIVNDAAIVSLNLLFSGRGTCKVCIGENLMETPGVAELMLLVNGVVIKRGGTPREVFASAQNVAGYIARQIADRRYSVWLSQRPGRTKDGDDRTDPAIIKMLGLGCGKTRADFEKLHIVPVAISYEFEPCATDKVREILMRREHGHYIKTPGEDLAQMRTGLQAEKGYIHLAFGEELVLKEAQSEDIAQDIAAKVDQQIWQIYRTWPSNAIAHAMLHEQFDDLPSPYAQTFIAMIDKQVDELSATGIASKAAREALLRLYAQPVINGLRARIDATSADLGAPAPFDGVIKSDHHWARRHQGCLQYA